MDRSSCFAFRHAVFSVQPADWTKGSQLGDLTSVPFEPVSSAGRWAGEHLQQHRERDPGPAAESDVLAAVGAKQRESDTFRK